MSIIAAAFTKNEFYIATDTLQARYDSKGETPFPGIICGFTTKITHYPHLKCSVVILGNSKTSHDHDYFVASNYFEDDTDLYNSTATTFFDSVQPSEFPGTDNLIGCIMIFGYSEKEKEMVVYRVDTNRERIKRHCKTDVMPVEVGIATFMSPRLSISEEDAISEKVAQGGGGIKEFILEVTKQIHRNSLSPDTYVFLVGGEINLTQMGINEGNFYRINTIPHRFPDYEENRRKIKQFRETENIIRKHYQDIKELDDAFAALDENTKPLTA
jgi:hypothetical protein